MNVLRMICMAFSTYSRIPMPQVKWEKKNADYVICFYPLVGLVVGLAEVACLYVARSKHFPAVVTTLLLIAIPILISGGIHLDGLIDTADARHSYLPKEEKLRILKDPHVGAFGVIRLLLYLMLVFAGLLLVVTRMEGSRSQTLWDAEMIYAMLLPVWCRVLVAITSVWFPKAKKEGMLQSVTGGKQITQTVILSEFALLCIVVAILGLPMAVEGRRCVLLVVTHLLFLLWYRRMADKEFGGVTGDLAGWLLCMLEGIAVAVLVPDFIL